MADVTIFGASGFIGAQLAAHFEKIGRRVRCVTRENWPETGTDLGDCIFAIGMTASFRRFPLQTAETQVVRLHEVLTRYRFGSLLYLSSTRVYRDAAGTSEESALLLRPHLADDIYNATKLAGEALCLALGQPGIRVARLSNVYGPTDRSELFLTDVLRTAITTGQVVLRSAPSSAKDYLFVDDAVAQLAAIAGRGEQRLYNVAAGVNVTNAGIAALLRAEGVDVSFAPGAAEISFPPIDTRRTRGEFGLIPHGLAMVLPGVFKTLQLELAR